METTALQNEDIQKALINIYSIVFSDGIKKGNVLVAAYEFIKQELRKHGETSGDAFKMTISNKDVKVEFELAKNKLLISTREID